MGDLSLSAWIVMILCYVICFGGAFYCLLLSWGKDPGVWLEKFGITRVMDTASEGAVSAGIYKPFEYMERGPKEKGIGVLVLFIVLMIGWIFGAFDVESEGSEFAGDDYDAFLDEFTLDPITGNSNENTEQTVSVDVNETEVTIINFTLTWDDEPNQFGRTNEPDEFQLNVTTPWGETNETPMTANEQDETGVLELTFHAPGRYPGTDADGTYEVIIRMGEAGEQWESFTGVIGSQDTGNDWTLTTQYTYYKDIF